MRRKSFACEGGCRSGAGSHDRRRRQSCRSRWRLFRRLCEACEPQGKPPRSNAANFIKARIAKGTTVNADEAGSWNSLDKHFEVARINHEEAYSLDGACTNWAESYFSRLRRAEIGHHHHVSGT